MKEAINPKKSFMVLTVKKKVSIFNKIYCYLIFTNKELIFAHLNKKKEMELFYKYQYEHMDSKYSFSEKDFRKYLYKYGRKYYEMFLEDIIEEDARNFYLLHNDIIRVLFKASKKSYSFISEELGVLSVQTIYKKFKFTHYYRDWNRNINNVLSEIYADRKEYIEGDKELSPIFKDGKDGFY